MVLRGRLVLDLATGEPPRVVAEPTDEEGPAQARALLHGAGGHLERARVAEGPLCRALRLDDLRPSTDDIAKQDGSAMGGEEPPELAA